MATAAAWALGVASRSGGDKPLASNMRSTVGMSMPPKFFERIQQQKYRTQATTNPQMHADRHHIDNKNKTKGTL
jgi:hypothetical protein